MNSKKVVKFLDITFPSYNNCTIIEEKNDKTVAILDYGKNDKLKVTIGYYDGDNHNLYKLLRTDFI